jgi:hypothetical protein
VRTNTNRNADTLIDFRQRHPALKELHMASVRDLIRQAQKDAQKPSGTEAERVWPRFGSPEVAPYGALGLDLPSEDTGFSVPDLGRKKADQSGEGLRDVFEFERSEALPLIEGLHHHDVDGRHLWIGVEEGKLVVANDDDHAVLLALIEGKSPLVAAMELALARKIDPSETWLTVLRFVARLAAAGMIRSVRGYHAVKKIRPNRFARFHLTHRCQLECVHCYTNSGPDVSAEGELTPERWIELVDAFADIGGEKILFTGGEALVFRGCIDVMRRAKARGLHVTLFSKDRRAHV